jgi:hypothetical protein
MNKPQSRFFVSLATAAIGVGVLSSARASWLSSQIDYFENLGPEVCGYTAYQCYVDFWSGVGNAYWEMQHDFYTIYYNEHYAEICPDYYSVWGTGEGCAAFESDWDEVSQMVAYIRDYHLSS